MSIVGEIWILLKDTIQDWKGKQVSLLAASMAYYTLFSLAPLIILAIMIVGAVFSQSAAEGEIVGQIQTVVGEDGARFIETAIANLQADREGDTLRWLWGLGFLAFGASGFFLQIQDALNRIWEVKPAPGQQVRMFLRKRLLSFSMVLVIAALVFLSILANTVLGFVMAQLTDLTPLLAYLWQPLSFLITLTILTLLITTVYMILPDARVAWSDALVGASITAVLVMFGQFLFSFFLDQTNFGSAYGFASSVIILITWVYYSAHIFFFGAEFTQVYARHHGHHILPEDHAVSTGEQSQPPA
jgi:membrane protein